MELWDDYDAERRRTGRTLCRDGAKPERYLHLVVTACLFNADGAMLIQQRSPEKAAWAGLWDFSATGSVLAGETSQEGIRREVKEELGLEIDVAGVRPLFTINYDHGFDDFYLLTTDAPLAALTLQKEEVAAARWATEADIRTLLARGEFVPYFEALVPLVFAMRGQFNGAIAIPWEEFRRKRETQGGGRP